MWYHIYNNAFDCFQIHSPAHQRVQIYSIKNLEEILSSKENRQSSSRWADLQRALISGHRNRQRNCSRSTCQVAGAVSTARYTVSTDVAHSTMRQAMMPFSKSLCKNQHITTRKKECVHLFNKHILQSYEWLILTSHMPTLPQFLHSI